MTSPRHPRRQGWRCGRCAGLGLVGIEVEEVPEVCPSCGGTGIGRGLGVSHREVGADAAVLERAIIELLREQDGCNGVVG